MKNTNSEFELRGVNHVAMVCKDMQRTVVFIPTYSACPWFVRWICPEAWGQHFFFDMGGGGLFAFFWFPDAADHQPGISSRDPILIPRSQ